MILFDKRKKKLSIIGLSLGVIHVANIQGKMKDGICYKLITWIQF